MSTLASAPEWVTPLDEESAGRRLLRRYGWNAGILLEAIALIAFWEIAITVLHLARRDFVPPPSDIWDAFLYLVRSGSLWTHVSFSVGNFIVGYVLAALVGIGLGVAMGLVAPVRTLLSPLVWTMYSTPRAVLAPLLIIWFGFGSASKVAVVFLMAVFPVLLNVLVGVDQVDRQLLRAGRVFGAKRLDLTTKVVLPYILPYTLTGLRLGIGRGLVGVVVGEFIGSAAGLGYLIVRSSAAFDMAESLAVALMLLVMANLSMAAVNVARRRLTPWYRESGES